MDKQAIKKNFSLFPRARAYENPATFQEELDRQCSFILGPSCIIALFSWILYIRLDERLFPEIHALTWLRVGLTFTAALVSILSFIPFFAKRYYILLFSLTAYFELAAAIIIGLVAAHPAYMGGLAMLILILSLMPFQRIHSIILLGATLSTAVIIGIAGGMKFERSWYFYGLFNLIAAVTVSLVAIFVLDRIRKVSFDKNRTIYQTNEKLTKSNMEIFLANEELKKANQLKGKLLEIAAHDLKNPLQVIIGYTDLLQDRMRGNRSAMQKLDIIFQSSDNMVKLLSRLLKALSIDSGKLILIKRDIDMKRLAETVIHENRAQAELKKQNIYFNAENECCVIGDESLLREVLDNLLTNALKFSPAGKSIWVNVRRTDASVICEVRDEGPGFNDSDKAKMFDLFQKLSAQPTGGESALGLGLAIVKDLVELHQGKISVISEPGNGSTFVVEIPRIISQVSTSSTG
ncbi:MAG: HAMP domain-containing histidine kinase [Candidatus Aminicenantes bacterium]|nr:HAMP domain-containing histidine kinase [Candidatus Aminicenantes bacterium]